MNPSAPPFPNLRTRIAPTPSGFLHIGNGVSFILSWLLARAYKGQVLLRIDDLDRSRFRIQYLEDIFYVLDWLGLDYDEGPANVTDFLQNYSQMDRIDKYHSAIQQLKTEGHLFACTCSRRQLREQSDSSLYPGNCRLLSLDWDKPQTAWRVNVPQPSIIQYQEWQQGEISVDVAQTMGDFIIRNKNGNPAYQIASLIDDLDHQINFIVRGADLRNSTTAQIYLSRLVNEPAFEQATFWHHPLIQNTDGRKLSKSHGASPLRHWIKEQQKPGHLYQEAAKWLGLAPQPYDSLKQIKEAFLEKMISDSL